MRNIVAVWLLVAALSGGACSRADQPAPAEEQSESLQDAPWDVRIEPLQVPAAGQSAQPHLSVSSRGLILSWLEHRDATATLKFAERVSGEWSPARTVSAGGRY